MCQHIDNILSDGELEANRTVKIFLTVREEGSRMVQRNRYKENKGYDRSKIAVAFNASTKGDQQWVRSQERKERYKQTESNNNNYRNQL